MYHFASRDEAEMYLWITGIHLMYICFPEHITVVITYDLTAVECSVEGSLYIVKDANFHCVI